MKKDEKSVDQMAEEAMKASDEAIVDQIEQDVENSSSSEKIDEAESNSSQATNDNETEAKDPDTETADSKDSVTENTEANRPSYMTLERPDNSNALDVLSEETKWDKKQNKKEAKAKAKQAKKRAKYADVDDDTYYAMKASGFHKAFGVFSLLLLVAGLAVAALSVYKLVIAPAYEQVEDSIGDLEVITMATPGDSTLSEERVQLNGLATGTDALVDTWVEEPFEASATDAQYDNMDYEEETVSDETVEE